MFSLTILFFYVRKRLSERRQKFNRFFYEKFLLRQKFFFCRKNSTARKNAKIFSSRFNEIGKIQTVD